MPPRQHPQSVQALIEEIGGDQQGQNPHQGLGPVLEPFFQPCDRFPDRAAAADPGQRGKQQQRTGHQGVE
ncbi:MAG: hypothetical protein ACK55I_36495, partial [bacterium]